ncbi:MAG TPA: molybdopterin-dependent oxidoreductase [Gemmatimonadaceae bacterium]|nr:molybdopterin-dependent oxidoreductase [Gemmatimonadaceae bacterium]
MTQPSGSAGVKRRDFLKVLGAAGATTTAIGCSQERVEKLIPYLVSPDQTVPGVSTYYATTCRECAAGCGVIAETRDGRAIKLEGNPAHPMNRGALCARGQSALQGLYNPDRYRSPMIRRNNALVAVSWDEALRTFRERIAALGTGTANAVFINQHETGSFPAFLDQWLAGYGMPAHIAYDGEAPHAVIQANRQTYGVAWPGLDFNAARLIVSVGADFLDTWGASVPQQLAFADARAKLANGPRFVYIGPRRSLTGLNADEWIACKPGSELAIVNALAGRGGSIADAATASGVDQAVLQRLASELAATKPSLVLAGTSGVDALDVALAVNALNQSAGNVGVTIKPAEPVPAFDRVGTPNELRDAVQRMASGAVPLAMFRGVNPVYTLPRALRVPEALARVPFKVSFSSYPDETSTLCDLVLPDDHALESWGDAEAAPGMLSLQQPAMERVFDTRATADVLMLVTKGDPATAGRYPMADYRAWLTGRFPGGASALGTALARGITPGTPLQRPAPARPAPTPPTAAPLEGQSGDFYLVVYPSPVLGGDGRGANKPWLQELADPVSKIAWQSWIEIHPTAAQRLGVRNGDHLQVQTPAGTVTAPAFIYLGVRPDTVAIATGRGHTAYGRYAQNIGVNALDALPVAHDAGGSLALTSVKAQVTKAAEHSPLVTTEGSARQHGRGIGQAMLASEVDAVPGEEAHHFAGDKDHSFLPGLRAPVANDAQGVLGNPNSNDKGMYDPEHWSGMANRRWAMTIDLARCTGCSACVTACYAENNIPTVGAPWQGRSLRPFHSSDSGWDTRPGANILKGREMTWIRIERYFEGGEDGSTNFDTRFVPMLCQHCGNAPCEPVCPVYATYHSPDGLNVQVYNRCVGTRYCSNGCPYKVRYFNWHGYGEPARRQYAFPEPLNWQLNPDVTVRGKGVMEKCTFCVQRIREAEHRATVEGRPVAPDEFTVACAQACPSRAIVFGDAADPTWSVARLAEDRRAYHVFEELNTYTAVVYLKKVLHPSAANATATAAPAAPPPSPQPAGGSR